MSDVDRLEARLFARRPARMVRDLDRIVTLTELLGRPQDAFPCVHVTGTNGKTTTTAMVAALLAALGLSAGAYTSPHLQSVTERVRVAGVPMSRDRFGEQLAYLEPFLTEVDARHPDRVTFFEALTALALVQFADAPVDVGVVEVGMGGRWDATNVVHGQVAVILPVGLDHRELGTTAVEVAAEKAGIIKPGAVVVSAAQEVAVATVLDRATAAAGGRLVVAGRDFGVASRARAVGGQRLDLQGVTGRVDGVLLPLLGAHQADNAACALAAVEGFLGFAGGLNPDVVRAGFAAVRAPGRLEVVRRTQGATVVLDGAHNPAGAACLARGVADEFAFRRRVLLIGVLGDKDVEGIAQALQPIADHAVVVPVPSPRAAPPGRVAAALRACGVSVEEAADVMEGLERASGLVGEGDGVLVTGSLYLVGAARTALGLPVT